MLGRVEKDGSQKEGVGGTIEISVPSAPDVVCLRGSIAEEESAENTIEGSERVEEGTGFVRVVSWGSDIRLGE